jgi:RTX calcium-binding nonapeptide repeat (4 copies)/Peptidase family M23
MPPPLGGGSACPQPWSLWHSSCPPWPRPRERLSGDLYRKGIEWCASTYSGHGTLSGYGPPLDLNGRGGVNDYGWPVHAPEEGRVAIYSRGYGSGWGNSIIWTSDDGNEKIHMAHLSSFGQTGNVDAGGVIGRVGTSGEAHRASPPRVGPPRRRPTQLELMGRIIRAGQCYVSTGPLPPTCLGREVTILGTPGDDEMVGTDGADVILGRGGADRVQARGGADLICGGEGNDHLQGRAGEDRIVGGVGADVLAGGIGADLVKGQDGPDTLRGFTGADRLYGEDGNDTLDGETGPDRLIGGPGVDAASFVTSDAPVTVGLDQGTASGNGEDLLTGMERAMGSPKGDDLAGDDRPNVLRGNGRDDTLRGKSGEDALNGGPGTDACHGGEMLVACER